MRRFSFVIPLMIFLAANASQAQQTCNRAWLAQQRAVTPSVAWDDFLSPLAKLFTAQYIQLPSDVTQTTDLRFTTGRHYTLLFYTDATALASGLEIHDPRGIRMEFEKVFGKPRNNVIELAFQPVYSGVYTLSMRSIFPQDRPACASLLIREWDDVEWKERLTLLGLTE